MSVLRYPGGKTRSVRILREFLPLEFVEERGRIVSPFFGGGSFELSMMNEHHIEVEANDKFEPLMNFWSTLKTSPHELITEIEKLRPITKERFKQYQSELSNVNIPSVVRGAYFFAVNRSSYSGSTCSGGFSASAGRERFTTSSIEKLSTIDLSRVNFHCEDFSTFIPKYPDDFLFLDPPYYPGSKLYGQKGDLHTAFDHQLLASLLSPRSNYLLCYNDCPEIRELYPHHRIQEVQWAYGMNKSKKSSEIVIIPRVED